MKNINSKVIAVWFLGSVCMLFGCMIAGNLHMGLGITTLGFVVALLISFVLILSCGLLWILSASKFNDNSNDS